MQWLEFVSAIRLCPNIHPLCIPVHKENIPPTDRVALNIPQPVLPLI